MRYVTSFERYGIKKGRQEGLLEKSREDVVDILQVRFKQASDVIVENINAIDDLAVLKQLHRDAVTVSSLDEFLAILDLQTVAA